MRASAPAPFLSRIRIYPIKSLDPVEVSEARLGPGGGLASDRVWALYASDGRWINGKRTAAIHQIRARFASNLGSVELSPRDGRTNLNPATFEFPGDLSGAGEWFHQFFGEPVTVGYAEHGFPDDDLAPGPTLISTASLEAVCGWFPEISLEQVRLRFRTNLEIGGIPAFGEDQLFAAEKGEFVRFSIGDSAFEGSNPCARCAVPPRDALTGEAIHDFQKRFAELRRANLPQWSPASRFDHYYRFALNTRVPSTEFGKMLHIGERLTLL